MDGSIEELLFEDEDWLKWKGRKRVKNNLEFERRGTEGRGRSQVALDLYWEGRTQNGESFNNRFALNNESINNVF